MRKSENTILKKWKELEQPSDEEKVIRRSLVKLRDYLRSQSRSTSGVVSKYVSMGNDRLTVTITKTGWMEVEFRTKKTVYHVKMIRDKIDVLDFEYLRGNRDRHDLYQIEIVTELKAAFKRFFPDYNAKVKTTSAASITKRIIPDGYSASINTRSPLKESKVALVNNLRAAGHAVEGNRGAPTINGTPANMY